MVEKADSFPRVIIRKGKEEGGIWLNFRPSRASIDSDDPKAAALRQLLELADDWTSYCISSLEFLPSMSHYGFFMVEQQIDEDTFLFLKSMSISNEELLEEATQDKIFSFIFHEDDLKEVALKLATTTQMMRAANAMKRSVLGSLIAELDFFMMRFLGLAAELDPKKFYDPNEMVQLERIVAAGGIDAFIDERINASIREKLRESHVDQVDWIMSTFELSQDVSKYRKSETFRDFVEICQRRHLLTHNGGIVNAEYIRKCKAAGFQEADLQPIGSKIDVSFKYMRRAAARVYLTGYFVLMMFALRNFPEYKRQIFGNLLSTSHDFLESENTKMAARVIEFAEFSNKHFDHSLKLKFAINRALAELMDPAKSAEQQTAGAIRILDKYDWSVTTPIFELAIACIRRDFSNLIPLAKAAQAAGLSYGDARTFVVFREARKVDGFLDCFPRAPLLIASNGGDDAKEGQLN